MTEDFDQRLRKLELQVASLSRRVWELESGQAGPIPASPVEEVQQEPVAIPVSHLAAEKSDWEADVGGNWLNRAGILLLVIGITLFLGYAISYVGPGGKIAIGAMTGGALLAAGYHFVYRAKFRPFALGLVAGGFAVLYITAYAAHAIEASRIFYNAQIGATLQIAIALAAIHAATRAQSQHSVHLGILGAYMGLHSGPELPFILTGLYPLTIGGLWLSHRFGWRSLSWAVLFYTWLSQISNAGESWDIAYFGQPFAWVTLTVFTAFEILWRRSAYSPATALWILANSFAFLLASVIGSVHQDASHRSTVFGLLTLFGLVASVVRYYLKIRYEAISEALTLVGACWWITSRFSKSDPLLMLLLLLSVTMIALWRNSFDRALICTITSETLLFLVASATALVFPTSRLIAETPVMIYLATPHMAIVIAALFVAGRFYSVFTWPNWTGVACVALLTLVTIPKTAGTIVLALEAILAIAAGLSLQRRGIRLGGLALFLFSIGKVFLYDLGELDTLSRILSFVILGLLLVGSSWAYTKYRRQLQEYL